MSRIAIAVAPTGPWGPGKGNPLLPEELARTIAECAEAGASVYHIHARDKDGKLTSDLTLFTRTAAMIASECGCILEASTGGISLMTPEERAYPVTVTEAQLGSLNMGSVNFGDQVYANSLPDIRLWIEIMSKNRVKPTLEIFDTGNIETALALIEEGALSLPCNFSFVFDIAWGMPFDTKLLDYLIGRLPEGSHWGANFIGSRDFSKHIAAAKAGASIVRTGFEDSRKYNGNTAASNLELVAELRNELEQAGFTIASIAESAQMLLA